MDEYFRFNVHAEFLYPVLLLRCVSCNGFPDMRVFRGVQLSFLCAAGSAKSMENAALFRVVLRVTGVREFWKIPLETRPVMVPAFCLRGGNPSVCRNDCFHKLLLQRRCACGACRSGTLRTEKSDQNPCHDRSHADLCLWTL